MGLRACGPVGLLGFERLGGSWHPLSQGRVALARFLMAEGFSLHDKDREGCTPLHLASKSGHYLMVPCLKQSCSDNQV